MNVILGNPPAKGAGARWLAGAGATLAGLVALAVAGTREGSLGPAGAWRTAPLVSATAPTQIIAPIIAIHRRGRLVRHERRMGGWSAGRPLLGALADAIGGVSARSAQPTSRLPGRRSRSPGVMGRGASGAGCGAGSYGRTRSSVRMLMSIHLLGSLGDRYARDPSDTGDRSSVRQHSTEHDARRRTHR